ncbi:MAG: transport system ATP-binding/permease protein [Pseudonocardiales bacterium]|jgi:ATP-binding cassette subfamily F protein uup|nr:transport system ATP-binding/permease protein [Pseudonocardiales bacterium]MDT4961475.1 transport system ATP-binding/permease protein [Pseudonocardiales bacterium]MDT4972468.1 transport system ATP-binding/permease protein [Pseudonocardiales bacterium]MDT4979674.1 transport system ATP-binding/permease protein [Pseudonocardiales bacterium]
MANLVNVENVTKAYGTTTVLDSVSLGIADGDRIGVVGRNGDGKTTLLRMITGAEPPDSGRVTRTGGVRVATVEQRGHLPAGSSVRSVVVGDGAEHEWAGDAAVREVLSGLGLAEVGLDADVARLSGGERRRVALARALVQQAQLLVLDEPTNHLDVEGITWLASYLVARRGALLVVTHDRWFLDAVCSRTWEVTGQSVLQYQGGYAAYVLARAERVKQADTSEARRQNLLRKELAWLRRGPPARTTKPKFRIDAAEALIADVPEPRSSVELRSLAQRRLGRSVYDVEDVTMKVGDRTLLDHVTWHVGPGDRVGIIGVNGSGKTHLLRLLAGELAPTSGTVKIGQTVHASHLSQEVTELPGNLRLLEAVQEVRTTATLDGTELSATQLAERFGFTGDKQWTPVSDLSGGERRRLQLLRLLLVQPNVLLLDEPTNDLDIDTLAALEDLLDSWPGTLVVVSHDRYLIERVCDTTVALLGDGSLAALPGGVDEYLTRRAAAGAAVSAERRERKGDSRAARKELVRLERQIGQLDKREATLHDQLATSATDFTRVSELNAELRAVVAEREAAEHAWLELSS